MIFSVVDGGNLQVKDRCYSMKNINRTYGDFKDLLKFYEEHKKIISDDELRKRANHILKTGCKQRTELETIMWILGEEFR